MSVILTEPELREEIRRSLLFLLQESHGLNTAMDGEAMYDQELKNHFGSGVTFDSAAVATRKSGSGGKVEGRKTFDASTAKALFKKHKKEIIEIMDRYNTGDIVVRVFPPQSRVPWRTKGDKDRVYHEEPQVFLASAAGADKKTRSGGRPKEGTMFGTNRRGTYAMTIHGGDWGYNIVSVSVTAPKSLIDELVHSPEYETAEAKVSTRDAVRYSDEKFDTDTKFRCPTGTTGSCKSNIDGQMRKLLRSLSSKEGPGLDEVIRDLSGYYDVGSGLVVVDVKKGSGSQLATITVEIDSSDTSGSDFKNTYHDVMKSTLGRGGKMNKPSYKFGAFWVAIASGSDKYILAAYEEGDAGEEAAKDFAK